MGRTDEAIEALMQVKYLFPASTDLAAQGMIEAAELMYRTDRQEEARNLLQRVAKDHGEDKWGSLANQKLTGMP
jgi:predicted negative regulator of RcsB-dependent stress response